MHITGIGPLHTMPCPPTMPEKVWPAIHVSVTECWPANPDHRVPLRITEMDRSTMKPVNMFRR